VKNRYKPHLVNLVRKKTSVGRDLDRGLCLDRNERVGNFPDNIIDDIYKNIPKSALSAYPDTDSLYKSIADWLKISKEKIYVTNGITEGIRVVFETLVNPGDKIVSISPTYPMYKIYAEIYQAKLYPVEFSKDLTLDIDSLYKSIDDKTSLVCVPNPNLPIESTLNIDQIRGLADRCKKDQAMLIIDEAYAFFGAPSALSLTEEYDNLIVFQTFSKAFGLAGIRLGYMISSKENIEYLSKTRSLVESNGISMAIGEYMLKNLNIMKEYVKGLNEGRDYVKSKLTAMGLKFHGGDNTNGMLIFLKNRSETEDLLSYLKTRDIYVRGSFGPPIEDCIRLTLGPKGAMEKFIEALSEWSKTSCKESLSQERSI